MTNTRKNNKKAYESFHTSVLKCKKCNLRKGCTQVVPGAGDYKSDIVLIGEGPGKNEDQKGIPFVGAAGKFLEELLASIHYSRESVYIANVVKCRPPNNRDPQPDEIETCAPWLEKQISIINPKVIITLGRYSLNTFIPDAKISEAHGKVFMTHNPQFGDRLIFAMYHPAAALYNGSMRNVLLKDISRIPKLLKKMSP